MAGKRWISVGGEGEATVAPDMAVVSLAVSAKGAELGPTRDDVNTRTSSVLERLRELGVADADLQAPDVEIHPEYDYRRDAQKLIGYRVSRTVTARVRALDTLGGVLDAISAAGANEVHGARMAASDPSAAQHAALAAAVEAARASAEAVASAAGVTLGDVIRVEEAERMDLPRGAMRMAAMAESSDVPTEVAAGELTVRRAVRARFAIE
jgi:uncharacterized protein YggE